MTDKADAFGEGTTARERAKRADVLYIKTPSVLGRFRIDVSDPDFDQVFASRANR